MNRNTNISFTGNYEVSGNLCFTRAKQRQGKVQKKCAARAKLFFFQISSITVAFLPYSLSSTFLQYFKNDFIFSLGKLLILKRASVLAVAKSKNEHE